MHVPKIRELWEVKNGTETMPVEAGKQKRFIKKDKEAVAIIGMFVTYKIIHHLIDAQLENDAWNSLKNLYEASKKAQNSVFEISAVRT